MNQLLRKLKSDLGSVYRGTREAMKSWDNRIRTRYAYYYKHCKIKSNVVLYEAYFGKGVLCNPYAIFIELLHDPRYKHLKHIWALQDGADERLLDEFRSHPNVMFVKRHSRAYLKYLCSAKYLVNNVTFHNYFSKKPGQVYINTWHGIPLKTLGYDMPNGGIETSNVIRNFLHVDYMVSASPFLTEIYKKAYKLENLYAGKIIEEGYPRLDLLVKHDRKTVFDKLRRCGVEADEGKQVILFAPTWRGTSYAQASSDVGFYFEFKEKLERAIDTSKYQILIKVHQRVYELAHDKLTEGYFIPSTIDANEVLAVTDILVSDFSSIYIDFLATGKPILFYIPDLESYSQERGLYRSPDCLPGPCAHCVEEIADWVNDIENVFARYRAKYDAERQWSNGYDAGSISKKIVDIVWGGNESGYKVIGPSFPKKKLLISRGKMLVNGISTSCLSLLEHIDYDKFDVSVMVLSSKKEDELSLIGRIDPRARVLCRNSPANLTVGDRITGIYYERSGYKDPFHDMYAREVRRSYGDATFDYVIDFEGYNMYYSTLALQFPGAYKCIWQHNDMLAEREEKYEWLDNIFGLYRHFDKVVSCAYDVMLVNREKLAERWCAPEKFGYMKNFIDTRRIEGLCAQNAIREFEGEKFITVSESAANGCLSLRMLPYIPEFGEDGRRQYRFVTIGRFSSEKNHENLIHAFHRLYQEDPNVYLYMLGDGKLKKETDQLIASLGLGERIFAPGNVGNPFCVLNNCDCFILPSLHEGQPMVINEARVLKMPIIVSNFSSVNGILVENGQLLIGTEAADIYEGLKGFIAGKVPTDYNFDAAVYNQEAYREFLNVLNQ